ncbi:MAG: prepilin-type N-terminal cleavage/methylation domain-containing protein [Candidatus Omnitrophica bacterium]|nr:prepilin-type N-terminal cleavage/methylation domain-containing protein [Candidatus Omnitrophota bacterium]
MRKRKGFTLIEMMIVVAIIALLATIAIPNYISFQYRAKTSEAKSNLGAIRTCEEAYRAEQDKYLACGVNPAAIPAGVKADWLADQAGWTDIGFEPKGKIYYQYQVTTSGTPATAFLAYARGNLDNDAVTSTFTLDQDGELKSTNPLE